MNVSLSEGIFPLFPWSVPHLQWCLAWMLLFANLSDIGIKMNSGQSWGGCCRDDENSSLRTVFVNLHWFHVFMVVELCPEFPGLSPKHRIWSKLQLEIWWCDHYQYLHMAIWSNKGQGHGVSFAWYAFISFFFCWMQSSFNIKGEKVRGFFSVFDAFRLSFLYGWL